MPLDLNKKIYLVTGKGGVGKTTISRAIYQHLKQEHSSVFLYQFTNEGLKSDSHNISFMQIALEYTQRKFKSKKVASLLVGSELFQAISKVLPNFRYLCIWGYITDLCQKNPGSYFVLDAPSSGHTLSALQSPKQFQNIFRAGMMFNDCKKIIDLLNDFLEIHYVTIPNQLNYNEMLDFKSQLEKHLEFKPKYHLNLSLSKKIKEAESIYIKNKLKEEKKILQDFKSFDFIFPICIKNLEKELSKVFS